MNRAAMLEQLEQTPEWDIIIIGGGATGVGCAADAASRGYKTLLAEQYDFGKGTSGRSTKLVHGGVRYLQQGNITLVMEALRERAYLLRNAPHITSAQAFVVPVYSLFDKWFYGIGLKLYDVLSGRLSIGKTKWLNKEQTIQQLPGIIDKQLYGGILYYDGQFDDTRLAIDIVSTAATQGATILNYCRAEAISKESNKITGITIRNTVSNKTYTVKAKAVINATGVFADAIMELDEPGKDRLIMPSQGVHVVVDKQFFPSLHAMMIPKTSDGRVLFAVPWHNKVIIGTTDTPVAQATIEPKPLQQEVDFIIHHANRYLIKSIHQKDIQSVFAGLRPLIKKRGANATAMLSRGHAIIVSTTGLITVSGGKWTTYRKMAEDAVNKAAIVGNLSERTCITRQLRINHSFNQNINSKEHFLHPAFHYTHQHIEYFVQHEMAMTVEDVLARRTRILFLNAKAAIVLAPVIARQMALLLQKDEHWIKEQVTTFTQLATQYYLPAE